MSEHCCPVVELRQYTLKPGMRDTLIELFDREFIESQEAVGCQVICQFRDQDDPNRFVWLRGFADMATRAQALAAFYGGPVWKAHREAANATMIDSDNVLLLCPARAGSGFDLAGMPRPPLNAPATPQELLFVTVCHLAEAADEPFLSAFDHEVAAHPATIGRPILGCFVTEAAPNNFPALPVRESERVFVWVSRDPPPARSWPQAMTAQFSAPPQMLRLSPTARSRLRA